MITLKDGPGETGDVCLEGGGCESKDTMHECLWRPEWYRHRSVLELFAVKFLGWFFFSSAIEAALLQIISCSCCEDRPEKYCQRLIRFVEQNHCTITRIISANFTRRGDITEDPQAATSCPNSLFEFSDWTFIHRHITPCKSIICLKEAVREIFLFRNTTLKGLKQRGWCLLGVGSVMDHHRHINMPMSNIRSVRLHTTLQCLYSTWDGDLTEDRLRKERLTRN